MIEMTEAEAREAYRAAWLQWALTDDSLKKAWCENLMDTLQPKIATSPEDPRWVEFKATLPGFDEFFARMAAERLECVQAVLIKAKV